MRWRKRFTSAQLDAMAEGRAHKRMSRPAPDYPPLHRIDLAVRITVENFESGRTAVIELRAPQDWRARCDQYGLWVSGELQHALGTKTMARDAVAGLMPRMLSARNF